MKTDAGRNIIKEKIVEAKEELNQLESSYTLKLKAVEKITIDIEGIKEYISKLESELN